MPIILKAADTVLRAVSYGLAFPAGDKEAKNIWKDFIGNAVSDGIGDAIDTLNSKQELYWSPYADLPNLGNVYSLPSLVTNGSTIYSFYQGQAPYTSEGGIGGYPYYTAKTFGVTVSDELCGMLYTAAPPGTNRPAPPVGVMYDGKVYAFYGTSSDSTGQVYYAINDGVEWSSPTPLPGVAVSIPGWSNTAPVVPVVFTPSGATDPALYVFWIIGPSEYAGGPTDIGCVAMVDGQWTTISADGLLGAGNTMTGTALSAVAYGAPGGPEQLYVFYNSDSWTNVSCISSADASTGFSAPTVVSALSQQGITLGTASTVVFTPTGATTPLLYLFASTSAMATGDYTDYGVTIPADEEYLGAPSFSYEISTSCYATFDGRSWSTPVQVTDSTWTPVNGVIPIGGPSPAILPPATFDGTMSPDTDIYFATVQTAQPYGAAPFGYMWLPASTCCAAFVGGLSQYTAGTAPSQVEPFPSPATGVEYPGATPLGPASAQLLAVDLPGMAAPQAWIFSVTYDYQTLYSVYADGVWTSYPLPTPVVDDVSYAPQITGSPSTLVVPTGYSAEPYMGLIAFNSSNFGVCAGIGSLPMGWNIYPAITTIPSATGSPSLAMFNNQAYLFYQGSDGQAGELWYAQLDPTTLFNEYGETTDAPSSGWSAAQQVPGVACSESPAAIAFNGDLYVFYQGANGNGQLWYVCLSASSSTWSAPTQVVPTGLDANSVLLAGKPSPCVYTETDGTSHLFVVYAGAGTSDSWQLTYSTLGSNGSWTQAIVSDVLVADSPTAYAAPNGAYANQSGAGTLNVFFQPASSPGQLLYCVYNGSNWSPVCTTPAATVDGWVSPILAPADAYAVPGTQAAYNALYLLHNNSGADAGQLGYCQCTLGDWVQGGLFEQYVQYQTSENVTLNMPFMSGTPAATIANGNIYVFYNSTYVENSTVNDGALGYMQIGLPADNQTINLGTYMPNAVGGGGYDALNVIYDNDPVDFIQMVNSPAAVTFQGLPYVFFNTGQGEIGYCTDPTVLSTQTAATSVAGACTPAVVLGSSTTSDGTCVQVLYLFYVGSTAEETVDGTNYEVGHLLCRYTTDGTSWTDLELSPAPTVNSGGVLVTVANAVTYVFYNDGADSYYVIFPGMETLSGSVSISGDRQISRMACSTGPCVATFDGNLWCVTQGVDQSSFNPAKGWSIEPSGNLFYARTCDGKCWTWNTALGQDASAPPMTTTQPVAVAFTPSSGTERLYVFWTGANGGLLEYVTTDGTYPATPSSTDYGLSWTGPSQVGGGACTDDTLGVVVMPPLDSPTGTDQLYVFWQGSNHSGTVFYDSMGPDGAWSGPTEIVPAGTSAAYMSQSPSVVFYAPDGQTPQPYMFCQAAGSSKQQSDNIGLKYCVYANGQWTQESVPNISYTTQALEGVSSQTWDGIDAATPPSAIVFNGKLYVFYVQHTAQWSENYKMWAELYPVTYSVFDGSNWSGPNNIGSTSTVNDSAVPFVYSQVPQFVSAAIMNETLYVFFMNVGAVSDLCPPPGTIYYVSTSDGSNWSSPQPTTNVVYVPASTTTLENNLGTEINDAKADLNGAISFIGLPTSTEVGEKLLLGDDD